jgi:hypothetical protein
MHFDLLIIPPLVGPQPRFCVDRDQIVGALAELKEGQIGTFVTGHVMAKG